MAATAPARTTYQIGIARRVALSFLLLLLLPFYASLAPMLLARFTHGMPIGTWGLLAITVAFNVVMALLLFQLLFAVRARVELGERGFRVNLPAGRGLSPMLHFAERELTYDQVQAVEVRREIYGAPLAPVLLQGVRILPKEGPPLVLGYVNEKCVDPNFPFTEIGAAIAARAHVGITDRGSVRRSAGRRALGLSAAAPDAEPIPAADIAALSRRHDFWAIALVLLLGGLLALGIVADLMSGSDSGATVSRPASQPASPTQPKPARK